MIIDSMDLAGPAAQEELTVLKALHVGTIRHGSLFPALDVEMDWVCILVSSDRWEFEGRFLNQPVFRMAIVAVGDRLQLETL